jgi:hypothetical protein
MEERAAFSGTVQAVADEFGEASITAQQLCEAVLRHHPEYGGSWARSNTVSWPVRALRQPVERWLASIGRLFQPGAHEPLHGRAVILGAGLVDRYAGRGLVESGLFRLLIGELTSPLLADLSDDGSRAIEAIPLAATVAEAGPDISLAVPDDGLSGPLPVQDVAMAPDGTVAAYLDAGVIVFSPAGEPAALVRGDEEVPLVGEAAAAAVAYFLARHRDPTVLAATRDGRTTVKWDDNELFVLRDDPEAEPLSFEDYGEIRPVAAAIDPNGEVVALARPDGAVELRRLGEAEPLARMSFGHEVGQLALSRGATHLAAAVGSQTLVVEIQGGKQFPVGDRPCTALAWNRDGELLAATFPDGQLTLWHAGTKQVVGVVRHESPLFSVSFAPDGRTVVAGGEGRVVAWPVSLPRRRTVAAYTADRVAGDEDLIGIKADAEALATLIAARTLVPPLSVAVFGDWGAGKSFFLRRLRDEVATIAAEARASGQLQRDIDFYKYVAQVEFNAWQYAEGNLWASLVEHILSNLYVDLDLDPVVRREEKLRAKARTDKLLAEAEEELAEAALAVASAGDRVAALENDIAALRKRHHMELAQLQAAAARDALSTALDAKTRSAVEDALRPLGVPVLGDAARDLVAAVAAGQRELGGLLPVLRAAGGQDLQVRRLRKKFVLAAVAGPVAALLVAAVTWALGAEGIATFAGLAGGAAASVRWLAGWFQEQGAWVAELRGRVDQAAAQAQGAIEAEQLRQAADVAQREQELSRLNLELNAKLLAQEQARQRVTAIETEQQRPAEALARYIEDRAASDDYRRHLGLPALVRRDFERISQLIDASTSKLAVNDDLAQEESESSDRVDRIVLYIDDLDRCPPRRVVEVLEAVHLLLAFPLFVVVVGVDSRWVLRSLESHYWQLLAPGDAGEAPAATPLDYVEKIFQVPYQLRPLDASTARRMLHGLLEEAGIARSEDELAVDSGTMPGRTAQARGQLARAGGARGIQGQYAGGPVAHEVAAAPPRDMTPYSLHLESKERRAMDELAALIGTTPRTVKRFANLYRILKVRALERGEHLLDARGPWADYEILLFLLAVSTGLPDLAPPLFHALTSGRGPTVGDVLANLGGDDGDDPHEQRRQLHSWFQDRHGRRWASVPAARCKAWIVDDVRRFSFIIHAARQANGDEPHEEVAPRPPATSEQPPLRGAAAWAGKSHSSPSKTSPPPHPPPDQTTRD